MKFVDDEPDTISLKGFEQILKALKSNRQPYVKIGVLGNSQRSAKGSEKNVPTNAEVGAAHEFGAPARNLPIRSFLRAPLTENLDKAMDKSKLSDEKTLQEVIRLGTIRPWLTQVAIIAEEIVQDAFDTGGGGKWPKWKDPNYKNNTGQILVDTQNLRDSIRSEVVDG